MGIFEALRSTNQNLGNNRDDLLQFFAGAAFGVLFLFWSAWTLRLVLMV